jgi:hypothetical protein
MRERELCLRASMERTDGRTDGSRCPFRCFGSVRSAATADRVHNPERDLNMVTGHVTKVSCCRQGRELPEQPCRCFCGHKAVKACWWAEVENSAAPWHSVWCCKTVCPDVSHFSITWFVNFSKGKGKAVPLHAMEALGGRGGIAPTHSRPRH